MVNCRKNCGCGCSDSLYTDQASLDPLGRSIYFCPFFFTLFPWSKCLFLTFVRICSSGRFIFRKTKKIILYCILLMRWCEHYAFLGPHMRGCVCVFTFSLNRLQAHSLSLLFSQQSLPACYSKQVVIVANVLWYRCWGCGCPCGM